MKLLLVIAILIYIEFLLHIINNTNYFIYYRVNIFIFMDDPTCFDYVLITSKYYISCML